MSCSGCAARRATGAGAVTPAISAAATADSAAASANAAIEPVQPISAPPMAGPHANAIVRANSMRPFARASIAAGTSDGTNAGAATLNTAVPHTATKPSTPSAARFSRPTTSNPATANKANARTASAPAIRARLGHRSASMPIGMANSTNGSVSATCSQLAVLASACRVSTATIGMAASAICSADCAARLEPASRLKPGGRWSTAGSWGSDIAHS